MKTELRTFRFVTMPLSLATIGTALAGAELSSPNLMFIAAGIGALTVASFALSGGVFTPPKSRNIEANRHEYDRRHEERRHYAIR
jgi:hypothetical protein